MDGWLDGWMDGWIEGSMLACGAGVLGCAFALNALDAPKVDEENFGSYTPQKAALLRDLGMGTYTRNKTSTHHVSKQSITIFELFGFF